MTHVFALAAAMNRTAQVAPQPRTLFYSVGDSLTNNPHAPPNGRWPYLLGQALGMPNENLGAPGQNTAYVLSEEIPRIAANCALVTVDTGANDFDKTVASMTPWTTYTAEMEGPRGVLATIEARCPHATIVVMTDVNDYPATDVRSQSFKRMNRYVRELPSRWRNVVLADIAADHRFFLAPNRDDGPYMYNTLHENAPGQPVMAQDIEAMLLSGLGVRRN